MPAEGQLLGGLFLLLWFAMMIGMVVGYIILLVAIWRLMKAHESIAGAVRRLVQHHGAPAPGQPRRL